LTAEKRRRSSDGGTSAGGSDLRVDLRHGEAKGKVRRGSKGETMAARAELTERTSRRRRSSVIPARFGHRHRMRGKGGAMGCSQRAQMGGKRGRKGVAVMGWCFPFISAQRRWGRAWRGDKRAASSGHRPMSGGHGRRAAWERCQSGAGEDQVTDQWAHSYSVSHLSQMRFDSNSNSNSKEIKFDSNCFKL
jgi:hypothetical protein